MMDVASHLSLVPAENATPKDREKLESSEPAATDDMCRLAITPFGGHLDRPLIYETASHPAALSRALANNNDNGDVTGGDMETVNMPFWDLPRRPKQHSARLGDVIPDDMSVISDASLIPTYCPTDVAKQQRPPPRALLVKRLIRSKARAARQAVRQLRRSCRDAVEHVFVDSAARAMTTTTTTTTTSSTKCFAVGSTQ
ncbi:hypothetical protein VTH06DRAFT_6134 [Thermothelomyces fergusii]